MAYLGRYQLGVEVPLSVRTTNSAGSAALPAACPSIDVYSDSAKVVSGKQIPISDRYGVTALFRHGLFLSQLYTAGRYEVAYRWVIGSYEGGQVDTFEVLAGGDGDGSVISMYHLRKPQASWIVQQRDSGKIMKGRNPRV